VSVCVCVCVYVCALVRKAVPATVTFLFVAKGNSRLQPCWLPTDLTLTPEVNTLVTVRVHMCEDLSQHMCQRDHWLVVTVAYVMGPIADFTPNLHHLCIFVNISGHFKHACVYNGFIWFMNISFKDDVHLRMCVCILLSAGMPAPCFSSLGDFNTFTAGFLQS